MRERRGFVCFAAVALVVSGGLSHATILTFDAPASASEIPGTYGDRVTGSPDAGGWGYLEGNGWTPNVVASYDTGLTEDHLRWWNTGYGDLQGVAFAARDHQLAYITLTADPGWLVRLNSFDAAGWLVNRADQTLQIEDGGGTVLADYTPYTFIGSGHTTLTPNLTAQSLTIVWGPNWNSGLDNINFDQVSASGRYVVPEPATMTLFGLGLAGLAARRLRKH